MNLLLTAVILLQTDPQIEELKRENRELKQQLDVILRLLKKDAESPNAEKRPAEIPAENRAPGYLGIRVADLSEEQKRVLRVDAGVLVVDVLENGPGQGFFNRWEVIRKIGGQRVTDVKSFRAKLRDCSSGSTVEVTVRRLGSTEDETLGLIPLQDRPEPSSQLGLGLVELSEEQLKKAGLQSGILVVRTSGAISILPAAKPNLAEDGALVVPIDLDPGDLILSVDNQPFKKSADLTEYIKSKLTVRWDHEFRAYVKQALGEPVMMLLKLRRPPMDDDL